MRPLYPTRRIDPDVYTEVHVERADVREASVRRGRRRGSGRGRRESQARHPEREQGGDAVVGAELEYVSIVVDELHLGPKAR